MIIDTHAHYDDEQFDADREALLGMMQENGIGKIVNASAAISSWDSVIELTRRYPFVYGMIGVHPDEVGGLDEEKFFRMEQLLKEEKIVAVGEIGLGLLLGSGKSRCAEKVVCPTVGTGRKAGKACQYPQPGCGGGYNGDHA